MPITLLTLPPEVRIMIFEHIFAGAMVRYEPRMYRPPYRRLTERYQDLLAPEVQILFTCKQNLTEARPVLISQATINISNIFAMRVPQRHAFMEAFVYPAVKKLRIEGQHRKQPAVLEAILPQLPQLVHLELNVIKPYTWWVEYHELSELRGQGITSEALRSISTAFKDGLLRFKGAIAVWKSLDHKSALTVTCDFTCRLPERSMLFLPPPPMKRICHWTVTADVVTGLITLTPLDTAETTHREKTMPMPSLD